MALVSLLMLALMLPAVALAQGDASLVEYHHGQVVLEGYLAQPKDGQAKHPAVLIVPDWMGVRDHAKDVAKRLADMGYVALAVDMYGKGVRPANRDQAAAEAEKYKSDRKLMRERVAAALDELKKLPSVDPSRIAAIGYCFGGTVVLELARSGAPVAGVVSLHGGLSTPTPQDAANFKGKVLVLHGADDPFVPPTEVLAFQEEMRKGNVDWQMIEYGNAVHAFTNPAAGSDNSRGAAYNEKADKRSWLAMTTFFSELFQAPRTK